MIACLVCTMISATKLVHTCHGKEPKVLYAQLDNLPVGAKGGSSTKLVAGMGTFSWPSDMSSHTNLFNQKQVR